MDDGLRMVQTRACGAWVLPGDPTCAGIARRLFRRVASELALDRDTVDDGVTMVSELAANTLHASQRRPHAANPELWLYLRGTGMRVELVCKVFDTLPGLGARQRAWPHRLPGAGRRDERPRPRGRARAVRRPLGPSPHQVPAVRHRARGKAVWFALPAPLAGGAAGRRRPATAGDAMTELEQDLSNRGFGGKLVRADDPGADMAVLSIASGLTVWCRSAGAWLRAPGVSQQQWSYCDLVEVGEQAVQAHESILAAADPFLLAGAQQSTGAIRPSRRDHAA